VFYDPATMPDDVPTSLAALEARVRRDLALIAYPEHEWVPPRVTDAGEPVLDVLIVGAGQGGQAIATGLLRERVSNILVIDRAPRGAEGPWRGYARMRTLRSWKTVTGPDLGIPSLTFQSWFEAQHGAAAFERLGKIDKGDWQDYLLWLREVLGLPVRNGVELVALSPDGEHVRARLREAGVESSLVARKVVLAMGIEASGRWWMPENVAALPPRFRAHTADDIDFTRLAGRRVAVLGAGASAFDNAATALEHGAAEVRLFCRRAELQRVQPYKAISYPGFLRHFGTLDDATRWRFANYLLDVREALPIETWNRCTRHANFHVHTGSPWEAVDQRGEAVAIRTPAGEFVVDFLICGTGFVLDPAARVELGPAAAQVATWADRYTPPPDEANPRLNGAPYLGPGHELTEKTPGAAPFLRNIHAFDFGATVSFGPSGSSINAMKFAVPRVVDAITRELFQADSAAHYRRLRDYQEPEFPLEFARDAGAQ
jgi:cation diffusion facilitator CzcD-associated flavoprotein CzcO